MGKQVHRLQSQILSKTLKPGYHSDGGGLTLQVTAAGSKSWVFRFTFEGKQREMGLGSAVVLSLVGARLLAADLRGQVHRGLNPLQVKRDEKAAASTTAPTVPTFKQCAETHIALHSAAWGNAKHAAQWRTTLEAYAFPVFGDVPVDQVNTAMVLQVLEPIWTTKPETATRVRGRIESVLSSAKVRGYRAGENPAVWRGHLAEVLPRRSKVAKVKHHAAMHYADLGQFMAELRTNGSMSAKALEFTILTAARTNEVLGAKWSEFDLEANVWTVPAERMKSGRAHRVPLSATAKALLAKLPMVEGTDYVVPSSRRGKPLSNMSMLMLLRGLRPGLTVHGYRSCFRSFAAECTGTPFEVCEAALAHVVKDATVEAYQRGDYFERRATLMTQWADHCNTVASDKVVTLPARAAG